MFQAEGQTDRQTDKAKKLTVTFRKLAKAPRKG